MEWHFNKHLHQSLHLVSFLRWLITIFYFLCIKVSLWRKNRKLKLKKGDSFGFSWKNYGVVGYGPAPKKNYYYERNIVPRKGSTHKYNSHHSNRNYAFQGIFVPYKLDGKCDFNLIEHKVTKFWGVTFSENKCMRWTILLKYNSLTICINQSQSIIWRQNINTAKSKYV